MDFRFPIDKIFPNEARWDDAKAWLRWIFLEDWATKTIALVITLFLWYGVTGQRAPTTKRLVNVRLNFQLPSGTEISNEPLARVEVTVTGDKSRVTRMSSDDLVVMVDLTGYKPGDLVVQLKPEAVNLELPSGVRLDEIEPNKASLRLEPRIEKLIEVKPTFTGSLAAGYELYAATVIPAQVRVRGAASHVNALDRMPTEIINLDNLIADTIARQITIDTLDPKITVLDPVVDVSLRIGEQRAEKNFANVAVSETTGAKAMPERAAVTLYGARSILDSLESQALRIELDTGEDGSITPRLVLPPEIADKLQLRSIKPSGFSIIR